MTTTTNARESATVEIAADELEQLRRKAEAYDRERRASREAYEREADNREMCRRVAEELEYYFSGYGYYDEEGSVCIADGPVEVPEDADPADYWDANEVYGVHYIVDEYGELMSVRYMVACGGPTIWLDTESGDVELYWGADVARYPMSSESIDWLEEFAVETMPRR